MSKRVRRLLGAALVLGLSLFVGSAGAAEEPNDFVYQLQRMNLQEIGETKFDLVIMDYSRDGSDERKFTAGEIDALKSSPGGPKTVGAPVPMSAISPLRENCCTLMPTSASRGGATGNAA